MKHIVLDIETLGIFDNSVVLSIGGVVFDPETEFEFLDLTEDNSFFVKLKAKDQKERLNRTVTPSTIEWWKSQNDEAKKVLLPSDKDVDAETAIDQLNEFVKEECEYDPKNSVIWVRGSLDFPVLHSLALSCGKELCFGYNRIRDVRTAIDILYNSNNGYTDMSKPCVGFIAHDPVHDCARDAMLLTYGIPK